MGNSVAAEWISVPEAARLKGVAESSVRLAIRSGHLTGAKVGRQYIVRRGDVETWRPEPRRARHPLAGEEQQRACSPITDYQDRPGESPQPTREEIVAFLQSAPHEQEQLLRRSLRPGAEGAFHKAARLKAVVARFAHVGISTEEYLREKRTEIEEEQRRVDT